MITTGQILAEGTATFTPALERTLEITHEFTNYFIYICIGLVGVRIIREAVKYIIGYLVHDSYEPFYREGKTIYNKKNPGEPTDF